MRKLVVLFAFVTTVGFVAIAPPVSAAAVIDDFTPTSGPVATSVTITGSGLTGTTAVRFGGVDAVTFSIDSDTTITATVPFDAVSGPITVVNAAGDGTSVASFDVVPTVESFMPKRAAPGREIVITGTGFEDATEVSFDGTPAQFDILGAFTIAAVVPPGATDGPISVTTSGGTDASADSFNVLYAPRITAFNPHAGPVTTRVTVTGTHFVAIKTVKIGKLSVHWDRLSDTKLRFRVPVKSKGGRIFVRTAEGSDTSGTAFNIRKDKHKSRITFSLSAHLVATGSVRSTDNDAICRTQRLVVVQRQFGGGWHGVRNDRTSPNGSYRVSLPDTEGTYRVVAAKKSTLKDLCSGATSDTKKHHHADGGGGGGSRCDPAYPTVCIPSPPPDLDCGQIPYTDFRVLPPDPHGFDGSDNDGWGCET